MGELHEGVLDTIRCFGAGFEIQLRGQLRLQLLNTLQSRPLNLQIILIANQHKLASLRLILLDLPQPVLLDIAETGRLNQIIHDDNGVCALVVC